MSMNWMSSGKSCSSGWPFFSPLTCRACERGKGICLSTAVSVQDMDHTERGPSEPLQYFTFKPSSFVHRCRLAWQARTTLTGEHHYLWRHLDGNRRRRLTSDFAQPRCFVLEESDLNLRNVGDVGIQDKLEIHVAHHAGLRQHQLKHMLVPAGAAHKDTASLRHIETRTYCHF